MAWGITTRVGPTLDATHGFSTEECASLLAEVESKYLAADATRGQRISFRTRLHLEELLLARACARGDENAWEIFWDRYQSKLRGAARSLTHNTEAANELADGLFAELFGLRTREGKRISKLESYMGLGSLEGWLRTLLAQAHVDQWRHNRRLVALDENDHLRNLLTPPNQNQGETVPAVRAQLEGALESVLASVAPDQRLLLNLYFLDGQTLAQIAGLLHVHESTVSRRLDRLIAQLRKQTRKELGRNGMRSRAAEEAMNTDPRWLSVDLRKSLAAHGTSHVY